ncbi:MAG: hypothetical protein AAGF92_13795 [Myxococcota bacterium]
MIDRRIRRSRDPYRALCLQLEHTRERGAFDAMVVAIDNGLLVAGAGEMELCEALSAAAPLVDNRLFTGSMPETLDDQEVAVRTVYVEGQTLFVASAGVACSDRWLQRSVNGVRRIIGGPEVHP